MSKRGAIIFSTILIISIMLSFVSAGPYGPGDSMDLKYQIYNGKIIYGYGNITKYVTSLRPKDVNSSEWKPELRREVINLTWDEIFNPNQLNLIDNIFKIQNNPLSLMNILILFEKLKGGEGR